MGFDKTEVPMTVSVVDIREVAIELRKQQRMPNINLFIDKDKQMFIQLQQ